MLGYKRGKCYIYVEYHVAVHNFVIDVISVTWTAHQFVIKN
jgi:hypothetical protein